MQQSTTLVPFDEWVMAEQKPDLAKLNQLMLNDFIGVGPRGFVLSKKQWLERFADLVYDSFDISEQQSITLQSAVIIVAKLKQTGSCQGHRTDGNFTIGQTWVETGDGWKIAFLQYTTDSTDSPVGNKS